MINIIPRCQSFEDVEAKTKGWLLKTKETKKSNKQKYNLHFLGDSRDARRREGRRRTKGRREGSSFSLFSSLLIFLDHCLTFLDLPCAFILAYFIFHANHINYHHILGKKGGGPMVEDAAIDKSPEFCKNIVLLVISYFVTALVML